VEQEEKEEVVRSGVVIAEENANLEDIQRSLPENQESQEESKFSAIIISE
jgi:uncharacterized protein YccT (UPF0319 family)